MAVVSLQLYAQQNVSISDVNGAIPNASSVLDISSSSKGLLIPRVALTSTSLSSPIGVAPLTSLLVYNTASLNDVTPGYYYWDGSKWCRFDTGNNVGDWKLLGNAGTVANTNFLGTTDAVDLVFRTNNTEKVRVLSGGKVGIGTNNPNNPLHVTAQSSSDFDVLRLDGSHTSGSGLLLNSTATGGRSWDLISTATAATEGAGKLLFKDMTGGSGVRMTIEGATGNVGIGTIAPNTSSLLEVSSTSKGVLIPRVALSSITDVATVVSPATSLLVYNTNLSITNGAGIGFYYWNGSSWQKFDTGNNVGDWKLLGNAGTVANTNFLGTTDNVDLVFRTNNTEKVRVQSGGNVGIGNAAPTYKLDITPAATTGTGIRVADNGSNAGVQLVAVGDDSYLTDLDAANMLGVYGQQTSTEGGVQLGSGGGYLYGRSGNVGIGTINPNASSLLEVNSTSKGILIPQVALTASNAASPITSPATSLLVYNNATAGTSPNNVVPGYYYNAGNTTTPNWKRFATGNGDAWIVGGNNFGTTGSGYNLGTSSNDHVDFITNNIVRGRLSNLGEFFIGTTATAAPGDLMNAVSNTTFPWAINGYSANNGSGTFGVITAGTTNFAGVQGEYSGTSVNGAGVRGIAINPSSVGVFGVENTGNGWAGVFNGDVLCVLPWGYYNASDQRLKTNLKIIKSAISKLQQINGYEYDLNIAEYSKYISKDAHRLGVMAQEVEKVFPDLVVEKFVPANNTKFSREENNNEPHDGQTFKAVNYDGLIPVLIEAIKEQQAIIEELQKRIEILEKK